MPNCPKCGSSNVQIGDKSILEKLSPEQQETLHSQKFVKLTDDQWHVIWEILLKLIRLLIDIFNSKKGDTSELYICCNDCHTISKL